MKSNIKYVSIAVVTVIAVYLVYDLTKPYLYPCESIFQQTATQIGGNVETIQAKGALFIGPQKIQELTERSQMLGLNLKTCCTLSSQKLLTSEEFLSCKDNVDDFKKKIEQVVRYIDEAETAQQRGDTMQLNTTVRQMHTLIEESESNVQAIQAKINPVSIRNSNLSGSDNTTDDSEEASLSSVAESPKPNNTILEAQAIEPGSSVSGNISDNDDVDYFYFNYSGEFRDLMEIWLVNLAPELAPEMDIFNQEKSRIHDLYDATAGADLVARIIAEPGRAYYISLSRYSGSGGPYKLIVPHPLEKYDEYEMNDNALNAAPIALGDAISANLLDNRDIDWYMIENIPASKIKVELQNNSHQLAPEVTVYNRNKSKVTERYNTTRGANIVIDLEVEKGATYYFSVQRWSGSLNEAAYRFTVTRNG